MRKLAAVVLVALWGILFAAGCSMIGVDEEKDMQRTIFEYQDKEVAKSEFADLYTYYEMVYEVNGYPLPEEGEDKEAFQEQLLESLVQIHVLKENAMEKELEIDEAQLEEDITAFLDGFKEDFEEGKYEEFLTSYDHTVESFESYIQQYFEDIAYANRAVEAFEEELRADSEEELSRVVMTLNGTEITKDEFYYHLGVTELEYMMATGSGIPSDEASMQQAYTQVLDTIAVDRLIKEELSQEGVTFTQEEIDEKKEELKASLTMFFDQEGLVDYFEQYYLTEEEFDAFLTESASRSLYVEEARDRIREDIEVSREQIEEHYEENKASYDTSKVSAMHILTESEDFAREIAEEATDGESFEAAIEKYKDDEGVLEATDLQEFGKGAMVPEFEAVAFDLEPGEVTEEPVQTDYGYHLIYVYDKEEQPLPTVEEKSEEIETTLKNDALQEQYQAYTQGLLEEAEVNKEEIRDPFAEYLEEIKEQYNVETYPSRL